MRVVSGERKASLETATGKFRRPRRENEKLKDQVTRSFCLLALFEAEWYEKQASVGNQQDISRIIVLVAKTETGFLVEQRARQEVQKLKRTVSCGGY